VTIPNYLATFRRAVRDLEEAEKGPIRETSSAVISLNSLISRLPDPEVAGAILDGEATRPTAAARARSGEKSEISEKNAASFAYVKALDQLERRCPDYVEPDRWQQCVDDAQRFLGDWADKAAALGWTAEELFGLHTPPAKPHPSYSRLSRYDATGLIWGLQGRRVIALTEATAAIQTPTGVLVYRRYHKPALGPLGDSLDDFACR